MFVMKSSQKLASFLAAALFGVLCFFMCESPTEAAISGRYMIRQAQSKLVMTGGWLPTKKYGDGSPVIIFQNENGQNKRYWRIEPLKGGEYRVMWQNTNLALDLARGERRNGVPIILWRWNGGANQRWRIVKGPHGAVFINVATGLAIDLSADDRSPRNRYQGYSPNNTRAQGFSLIKIVGSSYKQPQQYPSNSYEDYTEVGSSAASSQDGRRLAFSKVRVKLTLPQSWRYVETPATADSSATLELYGPGDSSAITITTDFNTDERAENVARQLSQEFKGTTPKKTDKSTWVFEMIADGIKSMVIVTEDRANRRLMVLSVTNENDDVDKIINSMDSY